MRPISLSSTVATIGVCLFGSTVALAADCENKVVTRVMAAPGNCAAGALAFRTDFGVWQCVAKTGTSYTAAEIESLNKIVLSAYLSGKTLYYSVSPSNGCSAASYSTSLTLAYMLDS